jgi:hypothetical protein
MMLILNIVIKKSITWFKIFIKAAKYYNQTTGNILGACERKYIISSDHEDDELKNFKIKILNINY